MERHIRYRRHCTSARSDSHIFYARLRLDNEPLGWGCDEQVGPDELRHIYSSIPDVALLAGIDELSSPRAAADCRCDHLAILCFRAISYPLVLGNAALCRESVADLDSSQKEPCIRPAPGRRPGFQDHAPGFESLENMRRNYMQVTYSATFFEDQMNASYGSAQTVMPHVISLCQPRS